MKNQHFIKLAFLLITASFIISCGSTKEKESTVEKSAEKNMFLIETEFGNMKVKLYDETPLHRDNFTKLVADSFYNDLLFHRVIKGFMIQGGDPNSKNAKPGQTLGNGNVGYTIPAEFNKKFIHKKGALAAARTGDGVNPQKASSGCQFYIVDGSDVGAPQLKSAISRKEGSKKRSLGTQVMNDPNNQVLKNSFIRARQLGLKDSIDYYGMQIQSIIDSLFLEQNGNAFSYSPEQIAVYDSVGGTPALDWDYTVFGEVVEGLNIIDSIAMQKTDRRDRPVADVKMTIKKL